MAKKKAPKKQIRWEIDCDVKVMVANEQLQIFQSDVKRGEIGLFLNMKHDGRTYMWTLYSDHLQPGAVLSFENEEDGWVRVRVKGVALRDTDGDGPFDAYLAELGSLPVLFGSVSDSRNSYYANGDRSMAPVIGTATLAQ